MHLVCCGCRREVSSENAKNILNDNLVIRFSDNFDINQPILGTKTIKLHDGVESLTGHKVSKAQDSKALCTACCEKMESFMIFRMQLLASFNELSILNDSGNISKSATASEHLESFEDQNDNKSTDKIADYNEISDNYKLIEPKVTVDDIDTHDNNIPIELNNSLNDESETNDSLGSNKLLNEQENNNFNDTENSNELQDIDETEKVFLEVQDNDIESEVDVYSGKDDEVLELDIQCRKDNIVDITNSSDSETEVCDYEPIGKKIKSYNALSPAVLF